MEWVYNPPPDSPTLYEASTPAAPSAPFDLFAPAPPVEPTSDEEPEYFGDTVTEDLIAPEEAFRVFAQRTDFSDQLVEQHVPVKSCREPTKITFAETRQQRIRRIRLELAELKEEAEGDDMQLEELQKELREIERKLLQPRVLHSVGKSAGRNAQAKAEQGKELAALERRVYTLEQSVGASHLSADFDGRAFAQLLQDVQTRLEFVSDRELSERLKEDAREIAEILQREVQSENGKGMIQVASVLNKMEEWEHIASTVPSVVERLRCFKRLQREAEGFESELRRVKAGVEVVLKRLESNSRVVEKVRDGLKQNLETVTANLDILQKKLDAMTQTTA